VNKVEEWVTVSEASQLLEISERQVLNRIYNGKLQAKKDGNKWLIHSSLSEPSELSEEVLEVSRRASRGEDLTNHFKEQLEHLKEQMRLKDEQLIEKDKQIERLQSQIDEKDNQMERLHQLLAIEKTQTQQLLERQLLPFWKRWRRKQLPERIHTEEE
jgi:excisionase family DNA binding protein